MRALIQLAAYAVILVAWLGEAAQAQPPYHPIEPSLVGETVMLTGHDLTIEQLVRVARHGAKVAVSPELRKGAADSFGLMLEAQAEGVPVYLFNRSAGSGREVVSLTGNPDSAQYKQELERRYSGPTYIDFLGLGEEIADEEVGRAMLVVDLNNMRYLAASAPFVQGIADLLNHGVTPAIHWHGALGEADFVPTGETLRGHGYAYYQGVRLPAADALSRAGLKPIRFEGADGNLTTTSALTAGFAALLVYDLRRLIEWHDLVWAMDLDGMNGSIGPLSMPVQATRPFVWSNYAAARVLDMLKGSYVFDGEYRTIQDPESLRATVWRDGGLWQAWVRLRYSTLIQMNSTDHNPTVRPDISPEDSWELDTPQLLKYYVKGGKYSNGKHGFIFSNSDWDPYPLADDVEALPISLVNLMVVVVQRMHRFEDTFFTVTDPAKVLEAHAAPGETSGIGNGGGGGAIADALWQELKPLANPIPPDGVTADKGVGDLDAVPMLKLMRLRDAMNVSRQILAQDLLNAAFWMDVRKLEKSERRFGAAPTAVWMSLRGVVPFRVPPDAPPATSSAGDRATQFLQMHAPESFYTSNAAAMPAEYGVKPPLAEPAKASRH
jgi:histidine ammonia-lyase